MFTSLISYFSWSSKASILFLNLIMSSLSAYFYSHSFLNLSTKFSKASKNPGLPSAPSEELPIDFSKRIVLSASDILLLWSFKAYWTIKLINIRNITVFNFFFLWIQLLLMVFMLFIMLPNMIFQLIELVSQIFNNVIMVSKQLIRIKWSTMWGFVLRFFMIFTVMGGIWDTITS